MTDTTTEQDASITAHDDSAALIDAVLRAVAERSPLAIRGGNTKLWYGHRVEGRPLDTRNHTGVVDYEPSELVLVARSGTPLAEVEALLARHRQMLPFEPPHYALTSAAPRPDGDDAISRAMSSALRGATLGGAIAAGLSGPRRMAAGSVRDFVLGARLIDGRGQHLTFGGRVMKNVAGYDVSRALAASQGTLGLITEVSLKVLPLPTATATLAFDLDEQAALDQLDAWAAQPIAITASAWRPQGNDGISASRRGRLTVRLEGSEAAVQSGIRRIGGLDVEPFAARAFWQGLREQTDGYFAAQAPDLPLWRLALPAATPALSMAVLGFADQLIEWGGTQRWIATYVDASVVRDTAARLGGHATLWRASEELKARHGVFAPLSAASMAIHRRLKAQFDPANLFNRGRLYSDL